MENLTAIILFAISSTLTPGPNNIIIMTSGMNYGITRSLPLLAGICVGFSSMLLLVGLGLGRIFHLNPELYLIIKIIGVSYLLHLAWLIARSGGDTTLSDSSEPLSFIKGALFQLVNAKAWIVSIGAVAAFTSGGATFYNQTIILASTFFAVSFPCVGAWLFFGSSLRKALKNPVRRQLFNYTMACLLVISLIPTNTVITH
ncbi:LysE family translocator [Marichromatium gracile]|uniref:LysE family translocator n=1 Tax=Marichromatium gracile TaxID=1048 RepID=UPI00104DC415|nr:LysE family translocator [Marichromatium gracile]MBK1709794.1 lysine transporter LysE [Marichromatium gracile]